MENDLRPDHLQPPADAEFVKCAAIKRDDGIILAGRNHAFVIQHSPEGTCKKNSQQGFITSKARFVNRSEAGDIAFAAGQIKKPTNLLFSEDITQDNPWAGEIITTQADTIEALQAENVTISEQLEASCKDNDALRTRIGELEGEIKEEAGKVFTTENVYICKCGRVTGDPSEYPDDYGTLGSDSGICCHDCGNEEFETIEALRTQLAAHRWIPVSEGLPEVENPKGEPVLFIKLIQPPRCYKSEIRWCHPDDWGSKTAIAFDYTHWTFLSALPAEQALTPESE